MECFFGKNVVDDWDYGGISLDSSYIHAVLSSGFLLGIWGFFFESWWSAVGSWTFPQCVYWKLISCVIEIIVIDLVISPLIHIFCHQLFLLGYWMFLLHLMIYSFKDVSSVFYRSEDIQVTAAWFIVINSFQQLRSDLRLSFRICLIFDLIFVIQKRTWSLFQVLIAIRFDWLVSNSDFHLSSNWDMRWLYDPMIKRFPDFMGNSLYRWGMRWLLSKKRVLFF